MEVLLFLLVTIVVVVVMSFIAAVSTMFPLISLSIMFKNINELQVFVLSSR